VVKENVQILSQCGIEVRSLLHLICTMLTNMVEIGVLKANAVVIVLKLANTPYQDFMVSMDWFLCLLW